MLHKNIIKIRDENLAGQIINELDLDFDTLKISIKDIITQRVYQEVERYNNKSSQYMHNLVQPSPEEVRLNKDSISKKAHVNAEKQVEVALAAFENNGFFILVDNYQVERLDELVEVNKNPVISFMKLTALVGG